MRRNMDLLRLLLLDQEGEEPKPDLSGFSEKQLVYHSNLLIEAGLVHGEGLQDQTGDVVGTVVSRLTWAGHEFLDSARDETTWHKTTGQLKKVGGSFALPLINEMLKYYAKQALGIPL